MVSQVDSEGHYYQLLTAVTNNKKDDKLMGKVRKHVRYDETSTGKGNYNEMHDKYLY